MCVWLSLVLLETASHCAYAQEEIYVCHTLVVCVSCHTCMLYTYRDVLASLPCQSLCAYMCPTYVLIHIHLCIQDGGCSIFVHAYIEGLYMSPHPSLHVVCTHIHVCVLCTLRMYMHERVRTP